MTITTKTVIITPGMASSWLANSKFDNRRLDDRNVDKIARDIKNKKWVFDGNPIRFDSHNNVIDGQHRLWAIVMANKEVESLVVRGLDNEAKFTIDSGKTRTNSDILHFAGHINNSALSSACRLVIAYRENKGDLWAWALGGGKNTSKKRLTPQEILSEANTNKLLPDIVTAAMRLKFTKKAMGIGTLAFSYWMLLTETKEQDEVELFFSTLEHGSNLALTDPRLLLRNTLSLKESYYYQDKGGNKSAAYRIAILIKTWNAWRSGDVVKRLTFNPEKEKYPVPK